MKIVVVSTPIFQTPVTGYAGLEVIAYEQARGLAALGHEVALVAPDGSTCPGVQIIPCGPAGHVDEKSAFGGFGELKDDKGNVLRQAHPGYWQALVHADVVLDHSWQKWAYSLKAEGVLKAPVLGWFHAPCPTMYQTWPPQYPRLPAVDKPCAVCISADQANHFRALHNRPVRVCYNGCFPGNTTIYTERGRENIGAYVSRSGRDRVLAWNESQQRFEYADVFKTLRLKPTNNFTVRLRTTAGLTLTSTPDNPIMTKHGWIPAHEVIVGDEVMYGPVEEVDRRRRELSTGKLREDSLGTDSGTSGTRAVVSQCSGSSIGAAPNQGVQTSDMDQRRRNFTGGNIPNEYKHGTDRSDSQAFFQCDLCPGTGSGVEEKEVGMVSPNGEASSETNCSSASLHGRDHRRGRVGGIHSGQGKVHPVTHIGGVEYGCADRGIRQDMPTDAVLARTPDTQSRGDQESKADLENEHGRVFGGGSDSSDHSVHDGQESKGRSCCGVLQHRTGSGVVVRGNAEIHGEANSVVSVREARKFPVWGRVVSVETVPTPEEVFDLQTSTGSFVANGIVVHNCDPEHYKPIPGIKRTDRFLFMGRFSTVKSPHIAIQACLKAGVGLDVVGDRQITGEPQYYDECCKLAEQTSPTWNRSNGKQITIHPGCSRGETVMWYSKAHAFLHSAKDFREPFGLAPVEAMACGLPVLSFDNGAIRETVRHGATGLLCSNENEFLAAIQSRWMQAIVPADREECREQALKFTVANMVKRCEELCQEAVQCPW